MPLTFRWVPDELLGDQLVRHGQGRGRQTARRRRWCSASTATNAGAWPRCSRASTCWRRATARQLNAEVDKLDWTQGVGPKLKQMLRRGVGVHHAGMLPKYRRVVEDLFSSKLLAVVRLHRDAGGRHQPAGPVGGADLAGQGAARQGEADRRQHGPPDLRPGRPAAVRRPRLRLRPGPRGRRQASCAGRRSTTRSPRTRATPACSRPRRPSKRRSRSAARTSPYWSEAQFEQLQGGAARQALQQGPAALAAAGLPAQDFAGGVQGARRCCANG